METNQTEFKAILKTNTDTLQAVKDQTKSPPWSIILTGIVITALGNADKISAAVGDIFRFVKGG